MRHAIHVFVGVLLGVGHVSAHAFLQTAIPAVGSRLDQAPTKVEINFTEGVEPSFSSIIVQDASGARVDSGNVYLENGDSHLAIGLKPLPPGVYKVIWHATAIDTHKTDGNYSFTVTK